MSVFKEILESLDVPPSYYEKAIKRYEDIAKWLTREESTCREFAPHIFPQGSMRLGITNKPIVNEDEFDLDLSSVFKEGISKASHTQAQVVELLKRELELYRNARGIEKPLERKHRCLRLEYKDGMSFHIDIVPGIPESTDGVERLEKSMVTRGEILNEAANYLAKSTLSITDDRDSQFNNLTLDWKISNPEGFARWVESQYTQRINEELRKSYQIDEIPFYQRKTVLQQVIQILKRHRDVMYLDKDKDCKPISVIITTLAARAYNGEASIEEALVNILEKMPSYIRDSAPKVPNPVNPEEDFADKWDRPECKSLHLEKNFKTWIAQARTDINNILRMDRERSKELSEVCKRSFNCSVKRHSDSIGTSKAPHVIIPSTAPKPWRK